MRLAVEAAARCLQAVPGAVEGARELAGILWGRDKQPGMSAARQVAMRDAGVRVAPEVPRRRMR